MTQKEAHKDAGFAESGASAELINECADFAKSYSGSDYFTDLALFLARRINVEYVLIGNLEKGQTKVNTVALFAHGNLVPNMSYPLEGTPCENVMGRNCCYYPAGVQQMFPTDKELRELNINSYIGSPLFDAERKPLGIMVLMSSETILNAGLIEQALHALTPRTEHELQLYVLKADTVVNQAGIL